MDRQRSGPTRSRTSPAARPQVSADRRTYTFTLRPGVRYAPPVDREVTAQDFITAIERFYVKDTGSPGSQWANLIAGATAFGAGEADTISGLAAPDPHTLRITLDQPADDFLSMLARPNFAPVPKEHADDYGVGKRYDGHVVGSGPYKLAIYVPGETVVLDRNPHWDPATDPLRKAWVDRIQIKLNIRVSSIQRAIDRGTADLSLTSHVDAAKLPTLRADPERSGRLSVEPSGCQVFLVLGTHPGAGAISDVRVRRAVNYAIDKDAYRDALARRYGAHGELASTILAPTSLGYQPYDLYPTPGGRGDPAKAKALLAEAGYPDGLTLRFATVGDGRLAAANKVIKDSLARAGIDLKVKAYDGIALWEESLQIPAKRLEHQLGLNGWCPDYLGDNARQAIVAQYDSRLPHDTSGNFSEYQRPGHRPAPQGLGGPDPGGFGTSSIQRAIEREEADLSLDGHVPQAGSPPSRPTPSGRGGCRVHTTGTQLFLVLGTHRKAGAIADVRVRQAVNYAIDKAAYRDAIAGRFAATGELASTILAPGSLGYRHYDLYPTPGGRGDPAKARALLAAAGYPKGLTLGFATWGSGRLAAGRKPIEESLKKAGIRPEGHRQPAGPPLRGAPEPRQAPGAPARPERLEAGLPGRQRPPVDPTAVRQPPPPR